MSSISRWARGTASRLVLRRCDRVGARPHIEGRAVIQNAGRIELGDDFMLASEPVASHLVTGPRGVLRIGNGVSIGHGAAISAHGEVVIGDGAVLGPFAMVLDTDFHRAEDHSVAADPKPIQIGARARLGAHVVVLRGARIGEGATVLAGSVVASEIAPGAVVAGVPARPLHGDGEGQRTVAELVREVLGLAALPDRGQGPNELHGWDSLGALNLLLAIEREYGISLSEEQVLHVRCIGDLEEMVAASAH